MSAPIVWKPQKRQALFMARPEEEALYGGAAGGGKSDCALAEALRQVHIPHYRAIILRKTVPQLSELIDRSRELYASAYPGAKYNETKRVWTFPSGARIWFGSMQHTEDRLNYQGKRYDFIDFDELTQFTWDEYSYLFSRNRPNGPGTRCYIRAQANPGGIGHGWVKARFITPAPPMTPIAEAVQIRHPDGHLETRVRKRIFVPSTVFDNEILLRNDPEYLTRLAALPDAERKALLYGDWDSFSGQVFNEWRNDLAHYRDRIGTHVIDRGIGAFFADLTGDIQDLFRSDGMRLTTIPDCTGSVNYTDVPARRTRGYGGRQSTLQRKSVVSKRMTRICVTGRYTVLPTRQLPKRTAGRALPGSWKSAVFTGIERTIPELPENSRFTTVCVLTKTEFPCCTSFPPVVT